MKKSLNEFYFADNASSCPEELEKMANALLEHIVSFMKLKKPLVLSCTIVDDAEIWKINKEYRKIDRPTDVISFAYDDDKSDEGEVIDDMGEIVISLDTAIKQAEFYKHPTEREIAFLFIHGFLHLMGYDHMKSEKDAEVMFGLQNDILNSFAYSYTEVKKQ